MAKPEWGRKRLCPSCGTKFYDLRKSPIVCPSCAEHVDPDSGGKAKKGRGAAKEDAARKPAAAAAAAAPAGKDVEGAEGAEDESAENGEESEDESEDYGVDESIEDSGDLGEDEFSEVVESDDKEEN